MFLSGDPTFSSSRAGDDPRRRRRHARLADRPAGAALGAGRRVDRFGVPSWPPSRRATPQAGSGAPIADRVLRRPLCRRCSPRPLLLALARPGAPAAPATPGPDTLPASRPSVQTYDALPQRSPAPPCRRTSSLWQRRQRPPVAGAIARPPADARLPAARCTSRSRSTSTPTTVATIDFLIAGRHREPRTRARTLRNEVVPGDGGSPDATAAVTAVTPSWTDYTDQMMSQLAARVRVRARLAFVLMLVAFRSLVDRRRRSSSTSCRSRPPTACSCSSSSTAAAAARLHLRPSDRLRLRCSVRDPLRPLDGLPRLLLSRIREAHDGGAHRRAVATGINPPRASSPAPRSSWSASSRLRDALDAARSSSSASGSHAVLLDATIVRAVLLPATMKLLGDWNWYLPRWLEWLPRLEPAGPALARAAGDSRLP